MSIAEQFGLDQSGNCWCCGGLGLCVDEWDAVERCLFCDEAGDVPDANFLAQLRPPMSEEDIREAAAAFEQAIAEWLRSDDGGTL